MIKIITPLLLILTVLASPAQAQKHTRYDQIIRQNATRTGIPFALIKSVIRHESGFRPKVVSPKGAKGLMQLMPATAKRFGVKNRSNPRQNIRGGTDYLHWLWQRYGDWRLVLAGYNAGEGAVDKYNGIPPYKETQGYVRRVLNSYHKTLYPKPVTPAIKQPPTLNPDKELRLFKAALHAETVISWQPPEGYYLSF